MSDLERFRTMINDGQMIPPEFANIEALLRISDDIRDLNRTVKSVMTKTLVLLFITLSLIVAALWLK